MLTLTGQFVMAQSFAQIINPFRIDIDPMERLLLVNFEKDPDSVYIGFEPQVFDDELNGKGHLVIGWRVDGRVDIYHQPGLSLVPEKYYIAGKGLANMVETEMAEYFFEINDFGAQASYDFFDVHKRRVVIKINESNPRKRKPFGLLAPMGHAAENPSALPLILLHDFYFVREKHSEILISIDGRTHRHDKLPIRIDGARMTFLRYCPDPFIASINPAFEGELSPLTVQQGWNVIDEDANIEITIAKGKTGIKTISRKHMGHELTLSFEPAFPDVGSIENNSTFEGRFKIAGHPSTGLVSGAYRLERNDLETRITMIPSKGWKPKPDRFSLRFLYRVAKIFRQWPKTYEWKAEIVEDESNTYMRSGWIRIND